VRQVVLRRLALELVRKLDDEVRYSTAQDAAFYEHRLQVGTHAGHAVLLVHFDGSRFVAGCIQPSCSEEPMQPGE
jgi:hypothetical protein